MVWLRVQAEPDGDPIEARDHVNQVRKEALVIAVMERHNRDIMEVVGGTLAEMESLPVEQAVGRLVAVAIEAHRVDPELHRVLAEQIPRVGPLAHLETANREAFAAFRAYLESHGNELSVTNLDLAAFVCATSIEALAHNAVLHHADMFSSVSVESLIENATRLVIRYLKEV